MGRLKVGAVDWGFTVPMHTPEHEVGPTPSNETGGSLRCLKKIEFSRLKTRPLEVGSDATFDERLEA